MGDRYGRYIEVSLQSAAGATKVFRHDLRSDEEYAIEFEIEMSKHGKVILYNLLDSTISMLQPRKDNLATLDLRAGWGDEVSSICRTWDVLHVNVEHESQDKKVELEVQSSGRSLAVYPNQKALYSTFVNMPASQILKALLLSCRVQDFTVDLGAKDRVLQRVPITESNLQRALDRIVREVGAAMEWRGGRLAIYDPSKVAGKRPVVTLNRLSGMIGRPSLDKEGWKVKSLLDGRVDIGEFVEVSFSLDGKAKDLTGKVVSGKHVGKSHGEDFYSEFVLVEV